MLMKKDDYIADLHLYCDLEQWKKRKNREKNYVQKPTVVPEAKNSRKAGREMKRAYWRAARCCHVYHPINVVECGYARKHNLSAGGV